MIRAHSAKEEQIQGQGGGADVAVPKDEPAKHASVRRIGGIVEVPIAIHQKEEHVSISQVGARRYPFSAIEDRKSTRLNSSHSQISYAVFCLKKKKKK